MYHKHEKIGKQQPTLNQSNYFNIDQKVSIQTQKALQNHKYTYFIYKHETENRFN